MFLGSLECHVPRFYLDHTCACAGERLMAEERDNAITLHSNIPRHFGGPRTLGILEHACSTRYRELKCILGAYLTRMLNTIQNHSCNQSARQSAGQPISHLHACIHFGNHPLDVACQLRPPHAAPENNIISLTERLRCIDGLLDFEM